MNWQTIITIDFCRRLCVSLLHTIWIVAILTVALVLVDYVLRRRSIQIRYILYAFGLAACLASLPAVYLFTKVTFGITSTNPIVTADPIRDDIPRPMGETRADFQPSTAADSQTALAQPFQREVSDFNGISHSGFWSWLWWSPWIVGIYVAGVMMMLVRLAVGVWEAHRLRQSAASIDEGPLVELLHSIASRWSMRVVPTLARARSIVVPKVMGLIRPIILLPISATTGLSDDELAMILAHELAHVRRHDMWINLLQRLTETVLFFNPGVWFISRRISRLREFCCDEAVCQMMNDSQSRSRVHYAAVLLRVAELAQENQSSQIATVQPSEIVTLAASGRSPSELRRRVAHLLGETLREPFPLTRGAAFILITGLFALLLGPVLWQSDRGSSVAQSREAMQLSGESETKDHNIAAPKKVDSEAAQQSPAAAAAAKEPTERKVPISVTGKAINAAGNPISGAKIYLASPRTHGKPLAVTETDRTGTYRFNAIPLPIERADTNHGQDTGSFEVFGEANGYGFAWRPLKWFHPDVPNESEPNWAEPDRLDFPTRYGLRDEIDLTLTFREEAKLTGRIINDLGKPISNTMIAIRHCDPDWDQDDLSRFGSRYELESLNWPELVPPRIKTRRADSDGRFEFDKLPANCRFWIDIRPPGHPRRMIHAVTREGINSDAKGNRVYSGNFEVEFARSRTVKVRVVYGDSGKPAPKVGVGGKVMEAGFWETTDKDGVVEVPLPDGRYQLSVSPKFGTDYLRTEAQVTVSAETAKTTTEIKLRPAAVVEMSVLDADTHKPLAGVDVWIDDENSRPEQPSRQVHGYRSWEVETRISHFERPRSDKDGKIHVLFEPGTHRIGVGLEAFPKGYTPVEPAGRILDCKPGNPVAVEFRLRKAGS